MVRENGNGTCEVRVFDAEERLAARACWRLDYPSDASWTTSYHYNAAGSLLYINDSRTGPERCDYDADQRLVAQFDRRGERRYTYAPVGNLTKTPRYGFVEYAPGNLPVHADFDHFSHDCRYRRAKHDRPGGQVTEYFYDSLDQLVEAHFRGRE
ncbi:hypothetical protein ACFL5O_02745 [Myxococcota bacterium]